MSWHDQKARGLSSKPRFFLGGEYGGSERHLRNPEGQILEKPPRTKPTDIGKLSMTAFTSIKNLAF